VTTLTTETEQQAIEDFARAMLAISLRDAKSDRPDRFAELERNPEKFQQATDRILNAERARATALVAKINDPEQLYEMAGNGAFDPRNKNSRDLLTTVTGIVLPKTVSGTTKAIRDYLGDFAHNREQEEAARKSAELIAEQQAEAKQRAELLASFDGFGAEFTPAARGKAYAALTVQMNVNGVVASRKDHIRNLVASGYRTATYQKGRVLVKGDNFFYEKDLTKTALDFADHLARQQDQKGGAL